MRTTDPYLNLCHMQIIHPITPIKAHISTLHRFSHDYRPWNHLSFYLKDICMVMQLHLVLNCYRRFNSFILCTHQQMLILRHHRIHSFLRLFPDYLLLLYLICLQYLIKPPLWNLYRT
ncbi:hypothetical protein BYT27DRAFT_6937355 [Phlegmacium glaucopus]|nr:hypothetical protein BYT27DRAFT_6937355 [Phlegmacium glaucopus]